MGAGQVMVLRMMGPSVAVASASCCIRTTGSNSRIFIGKSSSKTNKAAAARLFSGSSSSLRLRRVTAPPPPPPPALRLPPIHHCVNGKLESARNRFFSIRATTNDDVTDSIDSPLIKSMEIKIKEHLNAELVSVKDAYGDGRHVSINVVSSAFEGESAVSRQRMVYKAIWEELQSVVHAVDQMTTKTPSEAAAAVDS